MRIKEIRCDQFAGLTDREYEFDKGLNIIVGENESGKSTLVDLIYHMFFQRSGLDGRRDKDFRERYFPKNAGQVQGDVIDGVIRFETPEGVYKLSKEWSPGRGGQCRLVRPDGTRISDEDAICSVLEDVLGYGKGVYDELIFASQKRAHTVLSALLGGSSSDNIKELSSTITQAVMETGGIDIDRMEAELAEKADAYAGRWDFAADMPEGGRKRGIGNRWKVGAGKILLSYYDREEAAARLNSARDAELQVEAANAALLEARAKLEDAKQRRERFSRLRSSISERRSNEQLYEAAKLSSAELGQAASDWPEKLEKHEKAVALKAELELAKKKELFEKCSEIASELDRKKAEAQALGSVESSDVREAEALDAKIRSLAGALKGIDISAQIKTFGGAQVKLVSAVSGAELPSEGGRADITEAVNIVIPGVAEIMLSPKGVDAEAAGRELEAARLQLRSLLEKYEVNDFAALQVKQARAAGLKNDIDIAGRRLEAALGGASWEELRSSVEAAGEGVRSAGEVERDIRALSPSPIDVYIGRLSADISRYTEKYGDAEKLAQAIANADGKLDKLAETLSRAQAVPEEFAGVRDADEYDRSLKETIDRLESDADWSRTKLNAAERSLGEQSAEELAEDCRRADEAFERVKAEYARWKHILEVFRRVKESAKGSPMDDIEASFRKYLSEASCGRLALEAVGDDLSGSVTSGRYRLTEDILSEGTKETIDLAFRLAVLDHLFPQGGCTAVFDDPFTDMDPARTEAACRLLESFAERNQVIFVTCDPKYKGLMTGNCIAV